MQAHDPGNACPACGSRHTGSEYCDGIRLIALYCGVDHPTQRLVHRLCYDCGERWNEIPRPEDTRRYDDWLASVS